MFLENTVNHTEKFGWIEVICGSMFSGKTEELIRRLKRAQFAKQSVEIFKPAVDTRYAEELVVSHDENEIRCTPVPSSANIRLLANNIDVVGIDEAQFFDDEIIGISHKLADQGLRVIVAGLDTDFRGEPFGPMPVLMAQAERVDKLHAICMVCGEPASRTQRLVDGRPAHFNETVVVVGAAELYEARCRDHHDVPKD